MTKAFSINSKKNKKPIPADQSLEIMTQLDELVIEEKPIYKTISVRLKEETLKKVKEHAKKHDTSPNQIIRTIVEKYCK